MATTPLFPGAPKNGAVTIVPGDTTTKKTLYTAGASGAKLTNFVLTTDETAGREIAIWITIGGTDYLLGTVTLPLGAGFSAAVVPVNVFNSLPHLIDPSGALILQASAILKIAALTTITAAKTVYAFVEGADF